MVAQREKFSSQVNREVLSEIRAIARREGRQLQAVLEDAMIDYIEKKKSVTVRPQFMTHFRASLERNRRLGELLAQ